MSKNIQLLIVDPQNDLCDSKRGAVAVTGADEDMRRLAEMIGRIGSQIDDIHVTLDSHHLIHVAHPIYWKDKSGKHPLPTTVIDASDVRAGRWVPTRKNWLRHTRKNFGALDYVEALESNGKYVLTIEPPHCLIGSWGHNVYPPLLEALHEWEAKEFAAVNFVTKGANYHTEHYSAICADVPDPTDHTTDFNKGLLQTLNDADEILLAGEAASHSLANTALDADAFFSDDSFARKLVLLSDATSCIEGFEDRYDAFVRTLSAKGMRVTTTTEYETAYTTMRIRG